eukprot:Nitzschia sp. Nitz4//scaffold1_size375055//172367//175774//NITZ4_000269-RA/size375055-processed-gene-0.439-mRNA-1//-1//CDS//3329541024//6785//frame0
MEQSTDENGVDALHSFALPPSSHSEPQEESAPDTAYSDAPAPPVEPSVDLLDFGASAPNLLDFADASSPPTDAPIANFSSPFDPLPATASSDSQQPPSNSISLFDDFAGSLPQPPSAEPAPDASSDFDIFASPPPPTPSQPVQDNSLFDMDMMTPQQPVSSYTASDGMFDVFSSPPPTDLAPSNPPGDNAGAEVFSALDSAFAPPTTADIPSAAENTQGEALETSTSKDGAADLVQTEPVDTGSTAEASLLDAEPVTANGEVPLENSSDVAPNQATIEEKVEVTPPPVVESPSVPAQTPAESKPEEAIEDAVTETTSKEEEATPVAPEAPKVQVEETSNVVQDAPTEETVVEEVQRKPEDATPATEVPSIEADEASDAANEETPVVSSNDVPAASDTPTESAEETPSAETGPTDEVPAVENTAESTGTSTATTEPVQVEGDTPDVETPSEKVENVVDPSSDPAVSLPASEPEIAPARDTEPPTDQQETVKDETTTNASKSVENVAPESVPAEETTTMASQSPVEEELPTAVEKEGAPVPDPTSSTATANAISATVVAIPDTPGEDLSGKKDEDVSTEGEEKGEPADKKEANDPTDNETVGDTADKKDANTDEVVDSTDEDATKSSTPKKTKKSKSKKSSSPKSKTPDPEMLERIEWLENELQTAHSLIQQLQREQEDAKTRDEGVLVELQFNLQSQMSQRAEAEDKERRATALAKKLREQLEHLGSESKAKVEHLQSDITKLEKAREDQETELVQIREERDEQARKEASLASKLNVAKKQESEMSRTAEHYETQANSFQKQFTEASEDLAKVKEERDHLKAEVEQWKQYAEQRTKQLESSLSHEKKLNLERKKKMREFVEAKTEEVRVAKSETLGLQSELDQSNMTLKDLNQRYKQIHEQWIQSQTRNRELQRDITKIKMDSEKMSKVGGTLEAKLSRSALEAEDHKNKRLAAKHELMAVLSQLEAERELNRRICDSIRNDITPKTLSQQQSIQDAVDELEAALFKLSSRLGKPLLPPPPETDSDMGTSTSGSHTLEDGVGDFDRLSLSGSEASSMKALSKLENETQRVSQNLHSINANIERLHALTDGPTTRSCVDAFQSFLSSAGHTEETTAITGGGRRGYSHVGAAGRGQLT